MGIYGAFISLHNLHTNEECAQELCVPTQQDRIKILASLAPIYIPNKLAASLVVKKIGGIHG
jgi:hypothetical protein